MMKRYYKYIPYFLLERILQKEDDLNAPKVKYINDKEIPVVMLEIEKDVWIGANQKEFLLSQKSYYEAEIIRINKRLEELNNELSTMD
jgi:hypothetical protein